LAKTPAASADHQGGGELELAFEVSEIEPVLREVQAPLRFVPDDARANL